MSSMTTEHFELIGLLVILHIISKQYMLCTQECFNSVIILVYNKTVVERSNKQQEIINLSDYKVLDQNLWTFTSELISKMPISIEIKWIRGHQDSNEFGERIFGQFSLEVQINMLVDELATKGMERNGGKIVGRPNLSNEVVSIYDREGC